MGTSFPPQIRDVRGSEIALGALSAVISARTAVYVSSPITTGKRFAEWAQSRYNMGSSTESYRDEHRREVISYNLAAARPVVDKLRREAGATVIDPTAFEDIQGWTQDDYRAFWARVIERYAYRVVFMSGWEYSSGCAFEFLVAVRTQAETLSESLKALTVAEGLSMIRQAEMDLRALSQDTAFLRQVVDELQRIMSYETTPRTAL